MLNYIIKIPWYEFIGWSIVINWHLCYFISWIYILWLWLVSDDIKFEGWIYWKFIPVARFRLISTKSWYAKLWQKFYGFALFLIIIHRDEKGKFDDAWVEKTIVHEMRHVFITLIGGLLSWIAYGLNFIFLAIFTKRNPYKDNWFERDACRSADTWEAEGRPKIFTFGKRR